MSEPQAPNPLGIEPEKANHQCVRCLDGWWEDQIAPIPCAQGYDVAVCRGCRESELGEQGLSPEQIRETLEKEYPLYDG